MKQTIITAIVFLMIWPGCRPAKEITKVIAPRDSTAIIMQAKNAEDSLRLMNEVLQQVRQHHISFNTFSAKVKADVETSKEKLPDLTAVIRIIKDSAIWMSVSATFLNIEVYRMLITKDSVILLNKKDKEVQYRSLDYLQEVTKIPFDFKTVQDLLIGNPIFYNDSITSFRKQDNYLLISSLGIYFKHLLTLDANSKLLVHSKLDDRDALRNRTADINYGDFENINGVMFPTDRHIIIAEQNKIDMRLKFRQIEFNKELSVAFSVPKNYTVR